MAPVVTPHLPEVAHLLGQPVATTRDEMAAQAQALAAFGPRAVLVKGGHLACDDSPDVLFADGLMHWFEGARTTTKNTHGTGCTLSATLAAIMSKGVPLPAAVEQAKHYIAQAIEAADQLDVGHGHGPVHHFHQLRSV